MQFYAETLRRKGEARLQGYGNGVGSLAPRLSDTLVARLYRCSKFELRIANLCPSGGTVSGYETLFLPCSSFTYYYDFTAHRFHRETLSFFSFLCLLPFFCYLYKI